MSNEYAVSVQTILHNDLKKKTRAQRQSARWPLLAWPMEVVTSTPQHQTLVGFIATVGAKRGVRLMRAIRAADEPPRLRDPLATVASEFELRRLLNEDELHGAGLMYHYLKPEDVPIVEGRENGVRVMNDFRRAMRSKLLPSVFSAFFRDAFAEATSIVDLRKNLSSHVLAGARYVFDYFCPEECLPSSNDCEEEDAAQLRGRFSLRASMLNETDLALGWVTLLEFAAMRLVLRWSEMPSILRDGDDEYPAEEEREPQEPYDLHGLGGDEEGDVELEEEPAEPAENC